jgi:hypothetical protein
MRENHGTHGVVDIALLIREVSFSVWRGDVRNAAFGDDSVKLSIGDFDRFE